MEKKEAGFSLVELVVVMVLIGVIVGLAIPNWNEGRERVYNQVAQSDYRNVKTGVLSDDDPDAGFFYYYYVSNNPQNGTLFSFDADGFQAEAFNPGGFLPGPLSHVSLSEGTFPRLVYRYKFPNGTDYYYVWMDHERSGVSYRYFSLQGPFFNIGPTEQVITKN